MLIRSEEIVRPRNFLLLIVLLVAGCAGSSAPKTLSDIAEGEQFPSISLTQIPALRVPSGSLGVEYKPSLELADVADRRPTPEIMEFAGRKINAQGDLGFVVHYLLVRAMRQRGFAVEKGAALLLECSILRWRGEVVDNSIAGEAVVAAKLIGPGETELYSSVYEGIHRVPSERLREHEAQVAIGTAMKKALESLIADQKLIDIIKVY